MRILLGGATGFIGKELTAQLLTDKHDLHILSRSKKPGTVHVKYFNWNPEQNTIDLECLKDVDVIINLSGANVGAKRWNKAYKNEILNSRVQSTRLLNESLKNTEHHVKLFINASATGFYGNETTEITMNETSPSGKDFLAFVVKEWEKEFFREVLPGVRKVALRLGVVFSESDGALPKLVTPIKFGAGAPLATGKQYLSWVDVEDVINAFMFSLRNESVDGIYNVVAPEPVTNNQLTHQIAKLLNRPVFLPHVPSFILKLLIGEFADSMTGGSKVSSEKLIKAGFRFKFPAISDSLQNHLK